MDAAYTQQQMRRWVGMSEAAQHFFYLREEPGHYARCETCQKHLNPDLTPKVIR